MAAHPGAALSRESGVRQCGNGGSPERRQHGWEWEMIIILGVGTSEPLSQLEVHALFFSVCSICVFVHVHVTS